MSDGANVGSIVAYLTLRREDWSAGVRATEQDARRLGSLNPRIRIEDNTGQVIGRLALVQAAERRVGQEADRAKPFVMNLWAALAAAGPAAVPVAAVAGGALLGLLPVAAAVMLGISGIKDEMKSGALEGTQYGADLKTVDSWLNQLKATAASGLLDGVDRAVQQSKPLFAALNSDIGQTSTQIGDIVAGAAPALLSILHQLEPLFSTIGGDLASGAQGLEHWAQSSTGISKFVAYVQAELPEVEQLLGGVITLVSHLFQGAAGPGAALLHDINLLVDALDAIPVGVLHAAIPLAISLYAAIKTGQGVTAIVNGVNSAITRTGNALALTGPKAEAAAAQQSAAALAVQAATAEEAATVTAAQAAMATAAAEAAVEIAAATEGTTSVLAAGATAAAEAAIEEAAAFAAVAEAAAASAAEIGAAAEAAAATSAEAGAVASVGWASMLGPIGAVAVGVGLLSTLLISNGSSAMTAAEAQNSYADSVKKSTDATAASNRQQTLDNLAKSGVLDLLNRMHAANQLTTISTNDLIDAVNGSDAAYKKFKAAADSSFQTKIAGFLGASADDVGKFRDGLASAIEQQKLYVAAARAQQQQQEGGAAAANAAAHALGTTKDAYLDAQVAAQKNTDSTKAQTLAMQLESDAAGLLNQALMTLAGQNLSVAQAQTSFGQSLQGVLKSLHDNGDGIKGNSEKALANQQAIQGSVAAARQLAQATAQQTHSNDKAVASYKESKRELEDQLRAHHELTPAMQRYINKLFDVKGISDYLAKHPTKTDVDNGPASAKIDKIEARIKAIKQGRVPNIDADTAAGKRKLADLQAQIDALRGKTVNLNLNVSGRGLKSLHGQVQFAFANGGTVPGTGTGDTVPAMLTPEEEVTPAPQARKHRALLKAIAADQVPGYASGGTVYKVGRGYGYNGQYYAKRKDAESAASDARHQAQASGIQESHLGSSVIAGLASAVASQAATAQQVRDAAVALRQSAKDAGVSAHAMATITADQRKLLSAAAQRDSVRARLGTAPTAPTAYDRLAAAQQAYGSDKAKYGDAVSGFDITGVQPPAATSTSRTVGAATITTSKPGGGDLTLAGIIAADQADLAQVRQFDDLIHKLVSLGYDPDYVAQIASKGPSAMQYAKLLAAGSPKDVAQLNRLESGKGGRKAVANDLGTFLAKTFDGAGVKAAKSLVAGLRAQEKALTVQMERLGAAEAHAFERGLRAGRGGEQRKKGRKGKKDNGLKLHVHAAPGHSETTIARVAAAKILWHMDR